MKNFNIHTTETAHHESTKILDEVFKSIGFIPNVFATIAESPEALGGIAALKDAFGESSPLSSSGSKPKFTEAMPWRCP